MNFKNIMLVCGLAALAGLCIYNSNSYTNSLKEINLQKVEADLKVVVTNLQLDSLKNQIVLKDELLDSTSLELGRCMNKPAKVITKIERYRDPENLNQVIELSALNDSLEANLDQAEDEIYALDLLNDSLQCRLDSINNRFNAIKEFSLGDTYYDLYSELVGDSIKLNFNAADDLSLSVVRNNKLFKRDTYTVNLGFAGPFEIKETTKLVNPKGLTAKYRVQIIKDASGTLAPQGQW